MSFFGPLVQYVKKKKSTASNHNFLIPPSNANGAIFFLFRLFFSIMRRLYDVVLQITRTTHHQIKRPTVTGRLTQSIWVNFFQLVEYALIMPRLLSAHSSTFIRFFLTRTMLAHLYRPYCCQGRRQYHPSRHLVQGKGSRHLHSSQGWLSLLG